MSDPNRPVVLISVPTEPEAAVIVATLENQGIKAVTTGGYISDLWSTGIGNVQVLVRQADLEQAEQALQAIDAQTKGDEPEES